jgi:phospholipid/cholesterol/gamma-HCH transport system substrate-binding protein
MRKSFNLELKVGIFVTIGAVLTMAAILILGGADSIFKRTNTYYTHAPAVNGLIIGAKVVIGGLSIGTVTDIQFDPEIKDIKIELKVEKKYEEWIRKDTTAEMMTQGVLGDKFLSVSVGSPNEEMLKKGDVIPNKPAQDISQFLSKGDQIMIHLSSISKSLDQVLKTFNTGNRPEIFFKGLTETSKNLAGISEKLNDSPLKNSMKSLSGILEKINNGTGTLGALVNDPGLYYDVRALMGGANRNRIVRNLVRQTVRDGEEAGEEAAKEEKKKK